MDIEVVEGYDMIVRQYYNEATTDQIIARAKLSLRDIQEHLKKGEYMEAEMDGIEFYSDNRIIPYPSRYDLIKNWETPNNPVANFYRGFGFVNTLGYIIINSNAFNYVFNNISYKDVTRQELFRFFLHHEYGHLRDLYDGKTITPEEFLYMDAKILEQTKENEITADAYAIKDLDLSLERYTDYRDVLPAFDKKNKLLPETRYMYDRKIPYELSKKL